MKRKFFTFLMAFLATLSGAVWAQDQTYTGNHEAIEINGGGTKHVTFNNLTIDADAACKITGNTTVYLTLVGTNTLTSNRSNAGIYVEVGSTLIITKESEGASLTAESVETSWAETDEVKAAGIGGSEADPNFGKIIIEGGNITANSRTEAGTGHADGAGIGGGANSTTGTIIIKGGTINAGCLDNYTANPAEKQAVGAAIGGGYNGTVTAIAILGGNITTTNNGNNSILGNYNGDNIGAGKGGEAPTIIFGRWDKSTNQPTIPTESITKGKFCDARTGIVNTSNSDENVTLPAGLQMYLSSEPEAGYLNAYTMTLNKTVSQMDGNHTITVYTEDGNKTPDQVIGIYENLYYGANCTVEVPSNIHCTMGHHFMGWLTKQGSESPKITEPTEVSGTVTVESGSENKQVLQYQTGESDASGIVKTEYYATWVDNEMSILVKTETDWSTNSAPVVSVTPTEAISYLDYTFNAGNESENTELKVQDHVVGFSTTSGKENTLTGTPTLAQDYDQPSKTLTGITATVKVKGSQGEGVTVKFDPFTIYKYDMLITSAAINSENTHEYNGLDHNGTEGEPDHLLTVKGKIENGDGTEFDLREGVHYRIISYKFNDSSNETTNTTDGVKLTNAGKYSDITIMNRLDNGVKFDTSFSGATETTTTDVKTAKITGEVNIAKYKINVTPTEGSWTISSESNPTINFTPTAGSQVFSGETVTEKVAYTGSLGLSTTQNGTAITSNPTNKGTYYIVQNDLALTDDQSSGFDADNYELAFTSGVTFTVQESLTDNEDIAIDVTATNIGDLSDWTYDGTEHTLTITVKDGTDELTKDTDYTLSLSDGSSSSSSDQLTAKNAGEYTITITGKGKYTGSKTTKFTIEPKAITEAKAKDQTVTLGKVEIDKTANANTIELTGVIDGETPAFDTENSELTLATGEYNEVKTYKNVISISKLKLADNADGNFLADNYTLSEVPTDESNADASITTTYSTGNLIVKAEEDIEIDFPEGEDSDITVDADGNGTMVYNGSTPEDITLTISIKDEDEPLTTNDYTVTYAKENVNINNTDILNVGTYTITVTITKEGNYKDSKATKTLEVTARPLTVTIEDQTIEAEGSVETKITAETVTVSGEVEGETAVFTAESSLASTQTEFTAGTIYEGAITKGSTFALGNGEANNNFKADNYSLPESIVAADLTVKQSIDGGDGTDPIDPTDPDDKGNPIILPDGWTWDATSKGFRVTYDGNDHEVSALKVKFTDSESGESTYKELASEYIEEVTYSPSKPHDAEDYTASIEIKENDLIKAGIYTIKLQVVKREMYVDFILPSTIESTAPLAITNSRVKYEVQSGIRGLLTKEQYPVIESGQFIFGKPNAEGQCTVTIHNFILATSTSGFKPGNYQLQVWDAEVGDYVDYNNDGDDVTIIDPNNPDEDNPNNPGGGDSGVVVDPDGDGPRRKRHQPSREVL